MVSSPKMSLVLGYHKTSYIDIIFESNYYHKWNQLFRYPSDGFDTPENNNRNNHHNSETCQYRVNAKRAFYVCGNGIRLNHGTCCNFNHERKSKERGRFLRSEERR